MVAATNNFDIVKVMRVDSWEADTAVVHLTSEDLVTEEVVSENTTVTVGEVVRLSHGNIWKITKKSVHTVVLLLDIIKVFSMLVDSEGTKHVFQKEESIVVLMLNARSVVEDSNVRVVHLIVTNEHKSWDVHVLVQVGSISSSSLAHRLECVVYMVNKLFVVDVTGTNDN